ncbi:M23 family metallopeptidase [Streptomyces mexicanus]|jgi:murein DD-endopeptidase MepM/ murein hydrolase activator NlpD|uniref:M23 family metallopeptidase n=1 Tax=Streptomyces mexicanus TaxID=178566 RepID=UPI0036843325
MFQRATSRSARATKLRTRAAVLAAGLGVSAAVGAGVANAAETTAAPTAAAAAATSAAAWVDPVQHYTLTATFDQGGSHWMHKHSGQDFAVPIGTNVVAAHGGTVVKAGPNGGGDGPAYGNAIVIKHANGLYTQYAHLSRIDVKVGQVVSTGQHIALSGNTGNTTGPHLHFEVRTTPNYGSAVNPVTFLRAHGVKV